ACQQLTMWDRMPPLLGWMWPYVTAAQWSVMREVGLGGVQRYRAMDRDQCLMVALIERWDPGNQCLPSPYWRDDGHTRGCVSMDNILRLPIIGEASVPSGCRDMMMDTCILQ
ncbi:hypothetical protein KI387_017803, partial [Taxus chinensis]